ncbi:MAG: hypothetical protein RL685_210 [Pseudomonadota bacterium]
MSDTATSTGGRSWRLAGNDSSESRYQSMVQGLQRARAEVNVTVPTRVSVLLAGRDCAWSLASCARAAVTRGLERVLVLGTNHENGVATVASDGVSSGYRRAGLVVHVPWRCMRRATASASLIRETVRHANQWSPPAQRLQLLTRKRAKGACGGPGVRSVVVKTSLRSRAGDWHDFCSRSQYRPRRGQQRRRGLRRRRMNHEHRSLGSIS